MNPNLFNFLGGCCRSVPAGQVDHRAGLLERNPQQVRQAPVQDLAGVSQRRLPLQLGQRSQRLGHQVSLSICIGSIHGDRSIPIDSTCQLRDVKMTRRRLLHKGLTSAD